MLFAAYTAVFKILICPIKFIASVSYLSWCKINSFANFQFIVNLIQRFLNQLVLEKIFSFLVQQKAIPLAFKHLYFKYCQWLNYSILSLAICEERIFQRIY